MKHFMKVMLLALAASAGIMILLMLLILGYVCLYQEPALAHFAQWAETLPWQTEMPVYMSDGRIHLQDGTSFYPDNVLKEQYDIQGKIAYSYPACIVGEDLYMVHTMKQADGTTAWCISAVALESRSARMLYVWEGQPAVCDVDVTADHRRRAAWYQDGMICMNSQGRIMQYDVTTGTAHVAPVSGYAFPERRVWGGIRDGDTTTMYISMDGTEHAVTLASLSAGNPVIGEIVEKMTRKAGAGDSRFHDPFLDASLHTEDGHVWLLTRGVIHGGNTWMLFLRYDEEQEKWLCAGCAYSWDGRPDDYYIVPVAELAEGV